VSCCQLLTPVTTVDEHHPLTQHLLRLSVPVSAANPSRITQHPPPYRQRFLPYEIERSGSGATLQWHGRICPPPSWRVNASVNRESHPGSKRQSQVHVQLTERFFSLLQRNHFKGTCYKTTNTDSELFYFIEAFSSTPFR